MIKIADPVLPDKEKIKDVVDEIWQTKVVSNFGKYNCLFEQEVKKITKCEYAISVSSCDAALRILAAYNKNRNFLLPSFTFNSTFMSIWDSGMNYNFLDIDPKSLLVPLDLIEDLAKKKNNLTFVLVSTFGNMYNFEELSYLKDRYGFSVMMDSAHSFGSSYKDEKSGSGTFNECFSFSPTKLITGGEGGIICTNDKKLKNFSLKCRNYGFVENYNSSDWGMNGKLSELNAAMCFYSLEKLPETLKKKQEIIQLYKNKIEEKHFQKIEKEVKSTYKDLIILNIKKEELKEKLKEAKIESKNYFFPLHMQDITPDSFNLPFTDFVYENSLCVPSHTSLKNEEIDLISEIINEFTNETDSYNPSL